MLVLVLAAGTGDMSCVLEHDEEVDDVDDGFIDSVLLLDEVWFDDTDDTVDGGVIIRLVVVADDVVVVFDEDFDRSVCCWDCCC